METTLNLRRCSRRALIRLALAAVAFGRVGTRQAAALAQAATPELTGVRTEPLLALTLPAGIAPLDEIHFFRVTEAPRMTMAYPSYAPMRSISVGLLASGSAAISGSAPRAMLRAGGQQFEPVAGGAELALNPGDGFVSYDEAAATTARHPGAVPTETLYLGFYAAEPKPADPDQPMPAGASIRWLYDLSLSKKRRGLLSGTALTVTFTRLTVPPGITLPPADDPYPVLRAVLAGEATREIVRETEGSETEEPAPHAVIPAGRKITWSPMRPGEHLSISNRGSEPLVILAASIAPAEPGSTVPIAPSPPA